MTDEFVSVARFPASYNISALLVHLAENGVTYKLEEDGSGQVLYVARAHAGRVTRFLESLNAGEAPTEQLRGDQSLFRIAWQQWPVTVVIMALGLIGFLIARYDPGLNLIRWFTYVDYNIDGRNVIPRSFYNSVVDDWQWWRLVTPAFLHFGLLHIIFNGLGIWELGRRLELFFGKTTYCLLFLAIAQISNSIQYYFSGNALFGGLSGVLFGYVGLIAVLNWRMPVAILRLPVGMYVVVLLWALLGVTGVVNKVLGIQMADAAHIGGLLCGAIIGAVMPLRKPG